MLLYYDSNDFTVEEPERQKMIPITVNRERTVKAIREREKRDEEDRRNKDEEDHNWELEIIVPDPDKIKPIDIHQRPQRET